MQRFFSILLALIVPAATRAAPTVIELFTSQSCSSCPPADALLTKLAHRPDLLVLDMHIDYWNGIGWHDPYSLRALTDRQRHYAALLAQDSVYTPEMVVDGRLGVVGSDGVAVATAIAAVEAAPGPAVALQLHRSGTTLLVTVAAASGQATLWIVGYDPKHMTRVGGGENGGHTLLETNVVRSLVPVANWSGAALRTTLAAPPGELAAAFLQDPTGHIIGAGKLEP